MCVFIFIFLVSRVLFSFRCVHNTSTNNNTKQQQQQFLGGLSTLESEPILYGEFHADHTWTSSMHPTVFPWRLVNMYLFSCVLCVFCVLYLLSLFVFACCFVFVVLCCLIELCVLFVDRV